MQKIENLTAAGFPRAVRKGVVLVEFSTGKCAYCRKMDNVIDLMAISDHFPSPVRIARVNIDDAPLIAEKLVVEAVPALVLFRDGAECRRQIGVIDEKTLLEWLDS
jgi:thioredoxin 1